MMRDSVTYRVNIIFFKEALKIVCPQCKRVVMEGHYSLGFKKEEDKDSSFFLGIDVPTECCGHTFSLIKFFPSLNDADRERCNLLRAIEKGDPGLSQSHLLVKVPNLKMHLIKLHELN